jgi:xylan 1,4-beta-xylosidase
MTTKNFKTYYDYKKKVHKKPISNSLRVCFFFFLLCAPMLVIAQNTDNAPSANSGTETTFRNPILPGNFADPSILRDGEDYYMTHSSFETYPGLLIWHSKDLINWRPLYRALNFYVGSVWAPDLIKYEDIFYIYFPASGSNWVITSKHPEGPWSEPIELKINHIDPGHIVDLEGNRYLYFSGGWVAPLSKDGLSITGEAVQSYNGWEIPEEWDVACECLESPKLLYHKPYYYLTSAQGGTVGPATAHMVVSARSKSPLGPWENSPYNPIVHTWSKSETWHAKGHGTVFNDANENWWILYHGYFKDYYSLGRSSLLEPIEWTEDGWFVVPDEIKTDGPIPISAITYPKTSIELSDNFKSDELDIQWSFWRQPETQRIHIEDKTLTFISKGENPGNSPPLLTVPVDTSYEIQVYYKLKGNSKGGLILFYNESMYAGLVTEGERFTVYRRGQPLDQGPNKLARSGYLKIINEEQKLTFHYSTDGENWSKIRRSFVTECYNHTVLGGFLALKIGLVSIGEGSVDFKEFKYTSID